MVLIKLLPHESQYLCVCVTHVETVFSEVTFIFRQRQSRKCIIALYLKSETTTLMSEVRSVNKSFRFCHFLLINHRVHTSTKYSPAFPPNKQNHKQTNRQTHTRTNELTPLYTNVEELKHCHANAVENWACSLLFLTNWVATPSWFSHMIKLFFSPTITPKVIQFQEMTEIMRLVTRENMLLLSSTVCF